MQASKLINPTPRLVVELKPKFEVKVDLDDWAFLFPAEKSVAQLLFFVRRKADLC
jgi:hypothetical protein